MHTKLPIAASAATLLAGLLISTSAADARSRSTDVTRMVEVQPEPGRDKVPAMKPAWCDLTSDHRGKDRSGWLNRSMTQARDRGFYEDATAQIAGLLCAFPDKPGFQKQTGYFVQLYVNMTGLDTKRAIAAIRARVAKDQWKSQKKSFCDSLDISPEASLEQKRLHKARRDIFGCGRTIFWRSPTGTISDKLEWYLDKHAEVKSEVIKAYHVLSCLGNGYNAKLSDNYGLARYAVCGLDARSLSWQRLEKELSSGSYNTYAKTLARETFALARAANGRYQPLIKKLIARDATHKKVFVDAPKAGWNKWLGLYAKHKDIFEAAYAFEAKLWGPSKRALNGCLAPLRSMFSKYVRAAKPKNYDQFVKVATDEVGSVLLGALMPCAAHEGNTWEAYLYMALYKKSRDVRGPRYAAYYAVLDQVQEIRKDRERYPFEPKMFGWKSKDDPYQQYGVLKSRRKSKTTELVENAKGVVRSVRKTKDGVKLIFKTERWREEVVECTNTNKIWRIDQGTVKYFQKCVHKGYKWVKHTEKPVIVPKYATAGIRAGRFVTLSANYPFPTKGFARYGFPLQVYKSKRKKKLVASHGVAL